ncbi:hypothetical protein [Vibrio cholerae]|uniref:hypothetical protein n=1 Tax=Vibrio cholerae TaxID=666 RepID=UPI000E69001F|nr:hypothetical protein [Vibrio cholerae]
MLNEPQNLSNKLFITLNAADKAFANQYGFSSNMEHWREELKAVVMHYNQTNGTNFCPLDSVNDYIRRQNEFLNSNDGVKLTQDLVDQAMRQSHCKTI